ncbi:heavy metal-associated domain protein [Aeromicrobium marinum DSM 15272]|uniref:Heavy metal-associated domain protein n=1 Tax=Aeromicrobium marinum DSM 15272 TaxID=585531 RepID=E2SCB7_9ACTN|nr:heavy metal-associated domain-containing protein [Aeromicrobium marinum]EFQ82870.1 heavy metal-associated domain protein [Aeromicrobium marinum DSM 15272]
MSTIQNYVVTGMTCGHCESAIRDEVSLIAHVQHVDVSAATGRLTVSADQPVDDAIVMAAVDAAGYRAVRS